MLGFIVLVVRYHLFHGHRQILRNSFFLLTGKSRCGLACSREGADHRFLRNQLQRPRRCLITALQPKHTGVAAAGTPLCAALGRQ